MSFIPPGFPWKHFHRFLALQLAAILAALLAVGAGWPAALAAAAAFLGVSLWLGRRIFAPLGRLIHQFSAEADRWLGDEPLRIEGADRWSDLAEALERMREELRRKSEELRREREELAVLMASISDAILAVDREERMVYCNLRFQQLFGSGEEDGERRPSLRELFRAPGLLEVFERALRQGDPASASCQLHDGTGALKYFSVSATPLRRPTGGIYGAVGVFHDVTELKKAERVRIDFVANVSHELRTPLTAIKGYTDTLGEDARAGRYDSLEPFLGVVSRNVDRLRALVEDLLDLSSLESGEELQKEQLGTRELTERVLAQLAPKRGDKKLAVTTGHEAEKVWADPRRIEQVLVNLVDNALKYVPSGGHVKVLWRPSPEGVTLHVIDDGPGIPPESLERLFERFYRVDKARSREVGGTGLGLAIVKHIMQRHGGTATVRSELGKGAEFVCEFPGAGT